MIGKTVEFRMRDSYGNPNMGIWKGVVLDKIMSATTVHFLRNIPQHDTTKHYVVTHYLIHAFRGVDKYELVSILPMDIVKIC